MPRRMSTGSTAGHTRPSPSSWQLPQQSARAGRGSPERVRRAGKATTILTRAATLGAGEDETPGPAGSGIEGQGYQRERRGPIASGRRRVRARAGRQLLRRRGRRHPHSRAGTPVQIPSLTGANSQRSKGPGLRVRRTHVASNHWPPMRQRAPAKAPLCARHRPRR